MKFRHLIFILLTATVFCSCNSDPDDPDKNSSKKPFAELLIVSGDAQKGTYSVQLKDTLILSVKTQGTTLDLNKFYVRSTIIKGSGLTTNKQLSQWPDITTLSLDGKFKVLWTLGCTDKNQSVKFELFHRDSCNYMMGSTGACKPIDEVTFSATASVDASSGWTKICGIDWTDFYNTNIRSYGGEIYASNLGDLYKLKSSEIKYWEKISNVPAEVYDFDFDSKGKLYMLSKESGVFVTENMTTWRPYGTGMLDTRYPIGFLVEDSVVYASFMFDGIYRIRKNSTFAKKLLIDGKYHEEYSFPRRHPNGDLYLVDKWDAYWKSSNSGNLWSRISIEDQYVNYETADFKIHSSGMLYIGSGDASLAILSPTTYKGDLHKYYQWNASHQLISNIQFNGNDVYYLVSFTPDPGIYSSVTSWQKMALGFNKNISFFHRMNDGNFLIGSVDGIYYKPN